MAGTAARVEELGDEEAALVARGEDEAWATEDESRVEELV